MFYFAYGSNLHPVRLGERLPRAKLAGTTTLPGFRVQFNKRSADGSAKCSIMANPEPGQLVHGSVFEIDADERSILDGIEGLGKGYSERRVVADLDGVAIDMFTYVVEASHIVSDWRPYDWYKELVLLGARHHGFPSEYVERIAAMPSMPDQESQRREKYQALIRRFALETSVVD